MNMRPFLYMSLVYVALSPTPCSGEALRAEVSVAETEVTPQVEDKRVLVPADLEYAIEIEARCSQDSVPASLSIGVADTRHHFPLADSADTARFSTTFVVPGRQVAPLVTTGYCVLEQPDSQTTMLVPAALTAQISLACSSGVSSSMHYLSKPLAIRLICVSPDADQDVPSDSTR